MGIIAIWWRAISRENVRLCPTIYTLPYKCQILYLRPVTTVCMPLYNHGWRAENRKISRWSVKENMVAGAPSDYRSNRFHSTDECYRLIVIDCIMRRVFTKSLIKFACIYAWPTSLLAWRTSSPGLKIFNVPRTMHQGNTMTHNMSPILFPGSCDTTGTWNTGMHSKSWHFSPTRFLMLIYSTFIWIWNNFFLSDV